MLFSFYETALRNLIKMKQVLKAVLY